jgi:phage baseplate assembly protein gpV
MPAVPKPRTVARQLVQQLVDMATATYSDSGGTMQVAGGEIRVVVPESGAQIQVVMNPLESGTDTTSSVQGEWSADVTITESGGRKQQFSVPVDWVAQPPATP